MRLETLAIHAGGEYDRQTGAVVPPIHLATTFRHGPAAERIAGYEYQREGNPTNDRLRTAIAALEGAAQAITFASGMAAITTLLETFGPQARVIVPDDCYSGLRLLATEFLPERGIEVLRMDLTDLDRIADVCTRGVNVIWAETPSNPLMKISDIAALAQLAHAHNALLVVDNTFATPVLQQPLSLGADIVMHSTTKYFGGHSDVLGGALAFAREDDLYRAVAHRLHITGAVMAPFNAWLTLRGCRSLPARMGLHCSNALALAQYLSEQPQVQAVHYPGLPSHPAYALAQRQMSAGGGMLSVQIQGGREAALAVAGTLKLFTNATSLGGCESLVEHRASVEGPQTTTPHNLLRVSVGLEHIDDLIGDFAQALA